MSINLVTEFRISTFQQFLGPSGGSAIDEWLDRILILSNRELIIGLAICLVGKIVATLTVEFPPTAVLAEHVRQATDVYAHAGYLEYLRFSLAEFRLILPLHVWMFPRTVALLLIGTWVWRQGILRRPNAHKTLILVVAIAGTVLGLGLQEGAPARFFFTGQVLRVAGPVVEVLAQVALGLGYVAIAVYVFEFTRLRRLLSWAAPLGRMAFTNYVLQSLVFSWIFFGFGFGLFGRMSTGSALGIGVILYVLQVVGSQIWLKHYRWGPLEWLWRSLMYGHRRPMRNEGSLTPAPM
jgi:uncharacterized protein